MILDLGIARKRARLLELIRIFFKERGFLEIDPPALAPGLVPEAEIVPFATEWHLPWGPTRRLWLTPSPEVYLKKLLAAGYPNLFSLAKSYRNSENLSRIHNPEFTLVEWYEKGKTEKDLVLTLEHLLDFLNVEFPLPAVLRPPFEVLDLGEAFKRWADVDWTLCPDLGSLHREALRAGTVRGAESWENLWHWLLIDRVEPALPKDRPLLLTGWPSAIPTQAAVGADTVRARRWELVCDGVELVNACMEKTDPWQRPNRADQTESRDPEFEKAVSRLGPVSGAALGLDRLLMVLLEKKSLKDVIFFPFSARIGTHE